MDTGVAVRTSRKQSIAPLGGNSGKTAARICIYSVALVALEAQKGFPLVKKIIVNRSMRTVAVETVLSHIGMFIEKRTPLLSMALNTGFFDAVLKQVLVSKSSVGIVAVNTEHPSFLERMMARQGKLCQGILVAVETKNASGDRCDF
jgi:hypothetical protein